MKFEYWIQDRILAFKEAYLLVKHELKKNRYTEEKYVGTILVSKTIILYDNQHRFFKCNKEKSLRFNFLKNGCQTQSV